MSSLFLVVICIALNIVPANITSFQIVNPGGDMIRFTKLSTGSWQATVKPKQEIGTFSSDGKLLTFTPPQGGQMQGHTNTVITEIHAMLNLPTALDWSTVSEIALVHGGSALISRQATEISINLTKLNEDKSSVEKFLIRWQNDNQK